MRKRNWKLYIVVAIILLLTACNNESAPVNSGGETVDPVRRSDINVGTAEKENNEQDYSDEVEEPYTGNALWNSSLFEYYSYVYNDDLALIAANMSEKAERDTDGDINNYLGQDCEMYGIETGNYGNTLAIIPNSAAYAIAQSDLYIGDEYYKILVVVARGTINAFEGIGDVAKGGEQDFKGYSVWNNVNDFYKEIMDGIDAYVQKYPVIKSEDNLILLITGHSLGGAAANMVAARFDYGVDHGGEWWSNKLSKDDIYAYTFGAIKVLTTEENVFEGFENIHNIYNYYDSYGPYGNLSSYHVSSVNAKFGHIDLFDSKPLNKYGINPISDTEDHNMSRYIEYIEAGIQCILDSEEDSIEIDDSGFLLGDWLSVGDEGFGQAQPGSTVTFGADTCNFYSPWDSYTFYNQDDQWYLECTNPLWGDTQRFNVYFYDEDNIEIVYGSIVTELSRVK